MPREVGIQSIMPPRQYVPPQVLAQKPLENKDYNRYFYQSHSIILVICGYAAIICFYLFAPETGFFTQENKPFFAIVMGAVLISVNILPDTYVSRPHPIFWRVIMGLGIGYALLMTYLTMLPL